MNVIITGRRGEGKSTFAIWLGFESYRLTIAWDPRGLFYADRIVHSQDELRDALDEAQAQLENNKTENYFIAYVPLSGNTEEEFKQFAEALLPPGAENERHYFTVLVDEAGAKALQSAAWINPDLDRLLKRLPIDTTLMIQTAHSLKNFESGARDLIDGFYTFQLRGRSLESWSDFTDAPPEVISAVENLPMHHIVYYNARRHEGPDFEVISDPSVWYTPTRNSSSSQSDDSDGGDPLSEPESAGGAEISGESRRSSRESPFDRWIN